MSPYGERIARVETEIKALKENVEELKLDTKSNFATMDAKLDTLIKSHDKGAGILSLLAWIVGPSFITGVVYILPYLMRH